MSTGINEHPSTTKPTDAKRIAIIGSGYFSGFHIAAWQRLGVTITGLFTLDADSGIAHIERFALPGLYDNLQALLDDAPDLVDIIVPPEAQLELIKSIADRGIPIICQKPFCHDLDQAIEAADYCAKRQVALVVHENFRHQPWYNTIRQLLVEGLAGELYQATFRLRPGDGQGPDAYLARQPYFQQQPRFLVRETAVHFIDVFRYLFGEIDQVFASLTRLNPVIKGEDAGLMLFQHTSGLRTVIDANRLTDHASTNPRLTMGEFVIEGAFGQISLDGFGAIRWRAHGSANSRLIEYDWYDNDFGGDCVFLTQQHILERLFDYQQALVQHADPSEVEKSGTAISGNAAMPDNTATAYLRNRCLESAAYLSSEQGVWVPVPANLEHAKLTAS